MTTDEKKVAIIQDLLDSNGVYLSSSGLYQGLAKSLTGLSLKALSDLKLLVDLSIARQVEVAAAITQEAAR